MAAPRLFPFPMGKTRPEASVKDELWWEGGNAPHVVCPKIFFHLSLSTSCPASSIPTQIFIHHQSHREMLMFYQGHFNKPKIAAPEGAPDEETLIARVKKGMEIDSQRALWSKRIREIQYLSCVVITYFGKRFEFPYLMINHHIYLCC